MSLLELPSEILAKILGYAHPLAIRRAQQACRRVRDVITTNSYLQYILQLDLCGYTIPLVPRSELSNAKKIEMLQEQRGRWHNAQPGLPLLLTERIPGRWGHGYNKALVGGTYSFIPSRAEFNRTIYYYQLPSANRGTGLKKWHHDISSYYKIRCLCFHPEQDLLLIIEEVGPHIIPFQQSDHADHLRMHVRTMSSNAPHPVAALPVFDLDLTIDTESVGRRDLQAKIHGRFVAIKIGSSAFVIYDWVTCSKVLDLNRPNYSGDSHSCFLSADYLLVVSCLTGLGDSESRGIPSGPSIYRLDGSGINKTNPRPIARFILPDQNFQSFSNPSDTNIHTFLGLSSPVTREVPPSYWQTPLSGSPTPKVFELAPDNYALRLDINGGPDTKAGMYSGMLYINSRGLLDALVQIPSTETALITWEMWRHCTTWRETGHTKDFSISEDLCAQRALSLCREKHPFRYALYEFNRAVDNDNLELGKNGLNRGFSDATRSFTKNVVNDNAFAHVRYSCFMDDEHIVFAKAERATSDVE